jgi:hypothetical protein
MPFGDDTNIEAAGWLASVRAALRDRALSGPSRHEMMNQLMMHPTFGIGSRAGAQIGRDNVMAGQLNRRAPIDDAGYWNSSEGLTRNSGIRNLNDYAIEVVRRPPAANADWPSLPQRRVGQPGGTTPLDQLAHQIEAMHAQGLPYGIAHVGELSAAQRSANGAYIQRLNQLRDQYDMMRGMRPMHAIPGGKAD